MSKVQSNCLYYIEFSNIIHLAYPGFVSLELMGVKDSHLLVEGKTKKLKNRYFHSPKTWQILKSISKGYFVKHKHLISKGYVLDDSWQLNHEKKCLSTHAPTTWICHAFDCNHAAVKKLCRRWIRQYGHNQPGITWSLYYSNADWIQLLLWMQSHA